MGRRHGCWRVTKPTAMSVEAIHATASGASGEAATVPWIASAAPPSRAYGQHCRAGEWSPAWDAPPAINATSTTAADAECECHSSQIGLIKVRIAAKITTKASALREIGSEPITMSTECARNTAQP